MSPGTTHLSTSLRLLEVLLHVFEGIGTLLGLLGELGKLLCRAFCISPRSLGGVLSVLQLLAAVTECCSQASRGACFQGDALLCFFQRVLQFRNFLQSQQTKYRDT